MRMDIGLSQVMAQRQILSPQMIQSMEILVLNSQQLDERIDEELQENVALELSEPEGGDSATAADGAPVGEMDAGAATAQSEDMSSREIDLLRDRFEHLADYQSAERMNSAGPAPRAGGTGEDDDKYEALQNTASRSESLQEHLLDQLQLKHNLFDLLTSLGGESLPAKGLAPDPSAAEGGSADSPGEFSEASNGECERLDGMSSEIRDLRLRQICLEIVYNLDEQGRLRFSTADIHGSLNAPARVDGSGDFQWPQERLLEPPVYLTEVQQALRLIQSLDPAGVGALGEGFEGIKNCLLLQLARDPGEYPFEEELIKNHLKDIGKNRLPHISKATGRGIDEIKDAIEIISSLDPLPGRIYQAEPNAAVRPDVQIDEVGGVFKVRIDETYQPRLRISPYYRDLLERCRKDKEIRKYIKGKIDNAEWLLNAIRQRKSTLQRVSEEVVAYQQDFFRHGARALRPLKMQDIADKIGVNVSTVSRAISGKYFQAPGCIKDLKSLFTGGTVKDDGSAESRGAVILRIKDLLSQEDGRKPLSDAKIVELLKKEGISISRRTVTKYREAENIPSSRERRQF